MKCDSCHKDITFLYFIGKDNICNKCIAKHTVFKEVSESEDTLLRKALRAFEIKSFEDLRKISADQADKLAMGMIKERNAQTVKYKKNVPSAVKVDDGDSLDYQDELDLSY
jgi:adenylate kinase